VGARALCFDVQPPVQPKGTPVKAKLVVVSGSAPDAQFEVSTPATLGRGPEVELTFQHPQISREHCRIDEQDGQLYVFDLGSMNGTFVNEQKITEPTKMFPGDTLAIGKLSFRLCQLRIPESQTDSWDESDAFAADHLTDLDFGGGLSDVRLSGDEPSDS
jgi:predicted component of type VI protein secretion system